VATVVVSPANATIEVGSSKQLTADPRDAEGQSIAGRPVTWSSGDPAATVSGSGLVTGVSAGTATITATVDGKSGSAVVTVVPAAVATVVVTLPQAELVIGQTMQATALVEDAGGKPLSGRTVTWSVSNPSIATVSPSGVVTAVALGSTDIIATSEGKTGSARLAIVPVPVATIQVTPTTIPEMRTGDQVQLTVVLKDASGAVLTGRSVTFHSSYPNSVNVTTAGLVTAVSAYAGADLKVTASIDGKSADVPITGVVGWLLSTAADPHGGFPTVTMRLPAEPDGPSGSTLGEDASLVVACVGGSSRKLSLWVDTGGPITADGGVQYQLDAGPVVVDQWLESPETNFETLIYPGNRSQTAALAAAWGAGHELVFQYTQLVMLARIPKFVLQGMGPPLAAVLAACP
jgi:uncharacterized protein YjdB